jgi:hypothetical protein
LDNISIARACLFTGGFLAGPDIQGRAALNELAVRADSRSSYRREKTSPKEQFAFHTIGTQFIGLRQFLRGN